MYNNFREVFYASNTSSPLLARVSPEPLEKKIPSGPMNSSVYGSASISMAEKLIPLQPMRSLLFSTQSMKVPSHTREKAGTHISHPFSTLSKTTLIKSSTIPVIHPCFERSSGLTRRPIGKSSKRSLSMRLSFVLPNTGIDCSLNLWQEVACG